MKRIIFLMMMLIVSVSSFSQSKKALNSKITNLSEKVDALTTKLSVLNEKIASQDKTITQLKEMLGVSKSEPQSTSIQTPVPEPSKKAETIATTGKCIAITSSGNRCSRNAQEGSEYCWQHAKKYKADAPEKAESKPSKGSSYSGSNQIQTGPRGGKYYINSHGNKTYIKR
jgi:colicin import membrane protein